MNHWKRFTSGVGALTSSLSSRNAADTWMRRSEFSTQNSFWVLVISKLQNSGANWTTYRLRSLSTQLSAYILMVSKHDSMRQNSLGSCKNARLELAASVRLSARPGRLRMSSNSSPKHHSPIEHVWMRLVTMLLSMTRARTSLSRSVLRCGMDE